MAATDSLPQGLGLKVLKKGKFNLPFFYNATHSGSAVKKEKKSLSSLPDNDGLLELFRSHKRPLRIEGIMALTGITNRKLLDNTLRNLAAQGRLARLPGGFWGAAEGSICVAGQFQGAANGGGRVRVSEPADFPQKEIFISPFQTGGAWHKDIVRALILPHTQGGKGKILEVVERTQKEVPAILETKQKKHLRFRSADGRLAVSFSVPLKSSLADQIQPGELAILKPIKEIGEGRWQAEISRVIGNADRVAAQECIVKLSQQVPQEFPPLAIRQAEALPPAPSEKDMEGREDWRGLPFVTIDGANARDFDDAIHVEETDDGWILRVAIADVSHYVRPDGEAGSLDSEALARGNSWYFPRSVEPMLPTALSNGLCSLKPDEDRLAMMVEMPFTKAGEPLAPRFAPIVMRSNARLTYDNVASFFDGGAQMPEQVAPMLRAAHGLYKKLAQNRRKRGMLDFFLPEPAYEFDESGKLVKMGEAQRNDAHMLIEEFMIAANEAVSGHLESLGKDFLYRVHPQPEEEKLERLYETLERTAIEALPPDIRKDGEPNPKAIQQILRRAHDTPEEYVVNRLCLRSMAQARYQPVNIGHFGLASPSYCHFTSPIRRYADLLVHRALKASLGAKDQPTPDKEELAAIGDQLNGLERQAIDCEREMAKRLACLYLEGREGEVFDGVISGVTDFGIFMEFSGMTAEGLIRTEEMGSDWFRLDQPGQALIGEHTGQVWRLGQPIKARLLRVDTEKQEIRLEPAEKSPLKRPKEKNRSKFRGKERRSEHSKPARSSRWSKEPKPAKPAKRKK